MQPMWKTRKDDYSLLVEFTRSGRNPEFVGKTSEPYLIEVDGKSIEQVAYAVDAAHPWRLGPRVFWTVDGAGGRAIAPHAYLFYLLNNTRTYRAYEEQVIFRMPADVAQLHTGDDFYYYEPIREGDVIAVTATILPIVQKTGRHGPLTFFSDEWRMYNQHNRLAARLIRRGVKIDYEGKIQLASKGDDVVDVPRQADGKTSAGELIALPSLSSGEVTHVHTHGSITWPRMMAWLAAVDEYSPTHYDPDFAAAHRYGDGRSIVAGPQMAAMMLSPLERALGSDWWIESYLNKQLRPVYPNEVLRSFGRLRDLTVDGDRTCAHIGLWLVDDEGDLRGSGEVVANWVGQGSVK